jgi:hypothetical protein
VPNPDGSLTPEEQAIAAGGQPQTPADGTLTNPQAFVNPQGPPPAAPPAGAGDPLLDFQPPAPAAPTFSADSVPLPPPTPFPRGAVSSETTVPSSEMRQGYERGQAVNRDEQKLAADAGKTSEDEAKVKQDTAEAVDSESARQYAEQQAELQAQKDARDARERQYQSDIQEAKALARAPNGPDSDPSWKKTLSTLSVVLGQMGRGALGGENPAERVLNDRIKRDFDNRKMALENRYKELEITHGYNTDLENAAKDDYAKLLAGQKVRMDNLLKHGEAQLTALGVPRAQQASMLAQLGIQAKGAEAEQKWGQITSSKVDAKLGGTGAGSGNAMTELIKMQEDGKPLHVINARATQLGVKTKDFLPVIKDVQSGQSKTAAQEATKAAQDEKASAAKDARAVRDGAGNVVGLAPTARVVKQMQDRAVQYDDAIDSLEKLKKNKGFGIPMGADYDRAVLAVAATTTANASDTTTKHEAGTLKNYGLVSDKAINETLEHLKKRRAAFMKQLQPAGDDNDVMRTARDAMAARAGL